jgi:hypothetical protein
MTWLLDSIDGLPRFCPAEAIEVVLAPLKVEPCLHSPGVAPSSA